MTAVPADTALRLQRLVKSFPCLAKAPGLYPWEPAQLDAWAASDAPSHGEICTAKFILAIWNPDEAWRSGNFQLMEALRVWDARHRRAFLAWAESPWWA